MWQFASAVGVMKDKGEKMNSNTKSARLMFLSKVLSYRFFLVIGGFLMLAQPSMAAEGINGNLVSVTWLEKNLNHKEVL